MCILCRIKQGLQTEADITGTLNISYCPRIRTVRDIPEHVLHINCCYCTNLESIILPANLKSFNCSGCTFQKLPKLPTSLKFLYAHNCDELREIVFSGNLERLVCFQCQKLEEIRVAGFEVLHCYNCLNLISISNTEKTRTIDCFGCSSLMNVELDGVSNVDSNLCPYVRNRNLLLKLKRFLRKEAEKRRKKIKEILRGHLSLDVIDMILE